MPPNLSRHFALAARRLVHERPDPGEPCDYPYEDQVIPSEEPQFSQDSYAQVETLVLPMSRCGLQPDGITWDGTGEARAIRPRRPSPLTVRLSEDQRRILKGKAAAAGTSVNRFVLASSLGSDYRPRTDPELARSLLRLCRELNAQGNNLNQIARQLNAGVVVPGQNALLSALAASIQATLGCVHELLDPRGGE